jgi:hypothetical protein
MTPEARAHFKKLEENKRRLFPAKNISDKHPAMGQTICEIQAGMTGLVSAVELSSERAFLKPITVPDWDNDDFSEGDAIKKRKSTNKGGEAQSDGE